MLRLENFGITPGYVTTMITVYAICTVIACAVAILLWCLFCIGLARIAKARGEQKEWYAYLPLLRLYTLGKMTSGTEKTRKIFACLLPSLAVARFIMAIVSAALLTRAAAALIFAAENMTDSTVNLSALIDFPLAHCVWALVVTAILSVAYKLCYAYSYYGAVKHLKGSKPIIFTLVAFFWQNLSNIFLFAAATDKNLKNITAEETAG